MYFTSSTQQHYRFFDRSSSQLTPPRRKVGRQRFCRKGSQSEKQPCSYSNICTQKKRNRDTEKTKPTNTPPPHSKLRATPFVPSNVTKSRFLFLYKRKEGKRNKVPIFKMITKSNTVRYFQRSEDEEEKQ